MPPFARPGPSGRFPGVIAPTAALRLLVASTSLGFSLRSAVPAHAGDDEISQVPGRPFVRVRRSQTPVEETGQDPGLAALRFDLRSVAFRVVHRVGLHLAAAIGARCHRPRTRCLRFAAALTGVHARLASGWRSSALAGWESHPRVALKVSHRYMTIPFLQAFLAQEPSRFAAVIHAATAF